MTRKFKPSTRICIIEGCTLQVGPKGAKDMCPSHYFKMRNALKQKDVTGACECGCGLNVTNNHRFIHGHWAKANREKLSKIRSKNSRVDHGDGYYTILFKGKQTLEHIAKAEMAIGHSLPIRSVVHHVDGDRGNNENSNLVVCPDSAYHQLLHKRQRALEISGFAHYLKCCHCHKYDDPKNMYIPPRGHPAEHRKCGNEYRKRYYKIRRDNANA